MCHKNTRKNNPYLSSHQLTDLQKQALSLGTKFHYKPKFDRRNKQLEVEILYDSLLKRHQNNTIIINPDLKHHLKAEYHHSVTFTPANISPKTSD